MSVRIRDASAAISGSNNLEMTSAARMPSAQRSTDVGADASQPLTASILVGLRLLGSTTTRYFGFSPFMGRSLGAR